MVIGSCGAPASAIRRARVADLELYLADPADLVLDLADPVTISAELVVDWWV